MMKISTHIRGVKNTNADPHRSLSQILPICSSENKNVTANPKSRIGMQASTIQTTGYRQEAEAFFIARTSSQYLIHLRDANPTNCTNGR